MKLLFSSLVVASVLLLMSGSAFSYYDTCKGVVLEGFCVRASECSVVLSPPYTIPCPRGLVCCLQA